MSMTKEYHRQWRMKNREKIRARHKQYRDENREIYIEKSKKWSRDNPEKTLYTRIKSNAKTKGIEFSLVLENIIFPAYCPVLGVSLDYDVCKGKAQFNSPSFDRIDPRKGYVDGNVQIISKLANAMKQNATPEQLVAFGLWALSTYGELRE